MGSVLWGKLLPVVKGFIKGFGWNNVGPAPQTVAQNYISIVPCIVLSGVSGAGTGSVTSITIQQTENIVQSPNHTVPMLGQRRRLWVNIETALGEYHIFAQSIGAHSRPSDGLVLASVVDN